jgi:hypothetical protein
MPTTPETTSYLILGLVVTFIILFLLVGSMVIRYRNLKADALLLEQLEDEPQQK